MCKKKAIVFVPKNQNPPQGVLLGIVKITPYGTTVKYCVDGLSKNEYPHGWLQVVNEYDEIIETNKITGATPAHAQQQSTGFNPFGVINWDVLPNWIWLLLVLGIVIIYKSK